MASHRKLLTQAIDGAESFHFSDLDLSRFREDLSQSQSFLEDLLVPVHNANCNEEALDQRVGLLHADFANLCRNGFVLRNAENECFSPQTHFWNLVFTSHVATQPVVSYCSCPCPGITRLNFFLFTVFTPARWSFRPLLSIFFFSKACTAGCICSRQNTSDANAAQSFRLHQSSGTQSVW